MAYFFIIHSGVKDSARHSFTSCITLDDTKNKELVVNPHCGMRLILEFICAETGVSIDSDFDISTPTGNCLSVKTYSDYISGNNVFLSKQIYYIVLFDRDPDDQNTELRPLLAPKSKEYIKFMAALLAPKIKQSKLKRKGSGSVSISLTSGSQSKSTRTSSSKTTSSKTVSSKTESSKTESSNADSTKTTPSAAGSASSKKNQSIQSKQSKQS